MVIGHQKGRTVKDKVTRNFGMPAPEGYRKALRLMQMAERFNLPIITFTRQGLTLASVRKNVANLKRLLVTYAKCLP